MLLVRLAKFGGVALSLLIVPTSCGPSRGTIGAVLARQPSGDLIVHEVPKGLGGAKAGLEPGDQILLVDGIDVRGLTPDALRKLLSGTFGESVRVTVVRDDEILRLEVRRSLPRARSQGVPVESR